MCIINLIGWSSRRIFPWMIRRLFILLCTLRSNLMIRSIWYPIYFICQTNPAFICAAGWTWRLDVSRTGIIPSLQKGPFRSGGSPRKNRWTSCTSPVSTFWCFKAGQHFITAMNRYQKISFEQVLSERERTNGVNGVKYEPLNGDIIPGMEELSFEIDGTKF